MKVLTIIFILVLSVCVPFWDDNAVSGEGGNFHIVLDAGHGGIDNGAVVEGIKEADINLSIVKLLKVELEARNFKVSLTRENVDSLADPYSTNKKVSDMANRRRKIAELKPDLVLSIHQNKFPNAAVHGLQCFYASEIETSDIYAQKIQDQFNGNAEFNTKKIIKRTDFNLCEHSVAPAVLIECGFLSNATERTLLTTAVYQEKIAVNIATAIANMLIKRWYM
jgi:N-acetylmuramoyl-L-alanine amidase